MKKKNRICIFLFVMIGFASVFTNSCKKDETTSKKDSVITWSNPVDITYGTLLSATQLNATANVSGTFVYTPAIGTKLNSGANQDLKVDFTPTDAANYNAVSKIVKINVTKKDPIITWANPADIIFETLLSSTQLNATADVSGTFIYTPAIGTKLNSGANQDLKVDFTPTDAANYNTVSKIVKINVTVLTTVTDIDGNVYNIVTIGTQIWMKENLKTTKYLDGTAIPNITDNTTWINQTAGAYCWYNNDITNKDIYGALYNYHTIADTRNLCPSGWHVPTFNQLTILIDYLGGISIAGGKMKEIGYTKWNIPNTSATNESGFTALPGGIRYYTDGTFHGIGYEGIWWTNTNHYSDVWYYLLSYGNAEVNESYNPLQSGNSVRCIKD